jgi:hypothetical protein
MIDSIAERLIGKSPIQFNINMTSQANSRPIWLSLLLSAYESAWFHLPPVREVEQSLAKFLHKAKKGFPWLAVEFAEMCKHFDIGKPTFQPYLKTAEEFRQRTKTVPLSDLFAGKEGWALCLESLQALASETPKKNGSKPPVITRHPSRKISSAIRAIINWKDTTGSPETPSGVSVAAWQMIWDSAKPFKH